MLSRKLPFSQSRVRTLFWKKNECKCEPEPKNKQRKQQEHNPPDIPFLRPVRLEPAKVRLGFLPDEWFTMFYKTTGVTGPYMFGTGLLTYLFSKEIYVCEHEFYSGLSLMVVCIYFVKKAGPAIAKYCDKEVDKIESQWKNEKSFLLEGLDKEIDQEVKAQYSAEGGTLMIQAKMENIQLQLEADYRRRLLEAHKQVKNRLDYLVACRNVVERIEHKNKVNWVIKETIASITLDQKKEAIDKCFADLSALATSSLK